MLVSAGAWAADDGAGHADEPAGDIVHVAAGEPAPFAGELVTSSGLATLLTKIDDLERRLLATTRAGDARLRVETERRVDETNHLRAEIGRQHEIHVRLLGDAQADPPFWERPEFLFGSGVVVGALVSLTAWKLALGGSWP